MHLKKQNIKDFLAEHKEAFVQQESKFNLLLGLALRAQKGEFKEVDFYSFGRPGAAALQIKSRNLCLGELGPDDCAELASHFSNIECPGVVAPGQVGDWFVQAAGTDKFDHVKDQKIYQLSENPKKPPVPGSFEPASDKYLLVKWMQAFHAEADLGLTVPSKENLLKRVENGSYYFWVDEGTPVAMAAIVREGVKGATIGAVYTNPENRGHRYGEAVTAAVAEEILKRGKEFSNLYTDTANPVSNKIYERIGYKMVCTSKEFRRKS